MGAGCSISILAGMTSPILVAGQLAGSVRPVQNGDLVEAVQAFGQCCFRRYHQMLTL